MTNPANNVKYPKVTPITFPACDINDRAGEFVIYQRPFVTPPGKICTPAAAHEFLRPIFAHKVEEHFVVVHLDIRNRVLGWQEVAVGATNRVHIETRAVFFATRDTRAAALLLAHNHPSGEATPSTPDIDLTRRLQAAAEILGISIIDHIVMAEDTFFSFQAAKLCF